MKLFGRRSGSRAQVRQDAAAAPAAPEIPSELAAAIRALNERKPDPSSDSGRPAYRPADGSSVEDQVRSAMRAKGLVPEQGVQPPARTRPVQRTQIVRDEPIDPRDPDAMRPSRPGRPCERVQTVIIEDEPYDPSAQQKPERPLRPGERRRTVIITDEPL